jgi:stage IV sporulation protein FB
MKQEQLHIFGIPLAIDNTLWLLIGALILWGMQGSLPQTLLLLFAGIVSLVTHELGHAFAARHFGLTPIAITLHGMGGATTHRRPKSPAQSLLVSLAGPAAGFMLFFLSVTTAQVTGDYLPSILATLMAYFVMINLVWSLFNLIPIMPMDGGVALLAALQWLGVSHAWPIALVVGLLSSVALLIFGLYLQLGPFVLMFAGLFFYRNMTAFRLWASNR